jgi:hypothetical protein
MSAAAIALPQHDDAAVVDATALPVGVPAGDDYHAELTADGE